MQEIKRNRKALVREFYRGNRWNMALGFAGMIAVAAVNIALSIVMKELMDIAYGTDFAPLARISVICIGVLALMLGTDVLRAHAMPAFTKRAMRQYKDNVFALITEKGVGSFQKENTSRYLSALTNDVNAIEESYLKPVFTLVQQILSFFGALALLLYYSPLLTAVTVGLCILPLIGSICTGSSMARAEKRVSDENAEFVGTARDLLDGFTVIKSFRAEREAAVLFASQNEKLEEQKRKRLRLAHIVELLSGDMGGVAQFGVFLIGTYMAIAGMGVTAGMVISFVQTVNYLVSPIGYIPPMLAKRKAAIGLIDKLAEALYSNAGRTGKSVPARLEDAIVLENVSFGYSEDKQVLRDISCAFAAGKSYAIVGASGSGKSTLLNLLLGASENYEGSIRFDGEELRGISPESLFDIVSIVQQNVFVFNDTIRNNITMFRDFPEQDVERAIRLSGLGALIAEKGEGYICGENGKGLSGGERQRISIARCLLRFTPVMLIDEATAALDAATAYSVTKEIQNLSGLTRLTVTHRLEESLLRSYDEILVLRGGRIAERGAFDELMRERGYFYSLYTVAQD